MSASNSSKQARDLKHRVLTCLHKLSDRDTHAAAASELESIARALSADALPSFISSISATDSSDKSPVRRQCIRLVAVLSDHHGNALSPHLSKVLSAVVRRLRDPDSSVRSACVAASLSLSAQLTCPSFTSITKPFLESLFIEQDINTQNGAALCLAAVIEGSKNPDVGSLRKLLPRFEKLAKCDSFKAKAAILALMGSVVGVEGVLSGAGKNMMKNSIACLMEFLSSEDWAARKAAAEALLKIAVVEKDVLSEYKASCLKTFEAKRFDKVKATRETMNQMVEAWKEISDPTDEASPPRESQASSKEVGSDGRNPPDSKAPPLKKTSPLEEQASKASLGNVTPASATATRRRSSLAGNGTRTSPPLFRKLDFNKPSNAKADIAPPTESSVTQDEPLGDDGIGRYEKKNLVLHKGGREARVSDETGDICRSRRDCEDLSLIQKQLVQIETQQSHLLDILQRFIVSSQNGIHSLEARVRGLELALDEISFDLAVSTRRMSSNDAATCCSLPGTEFLSSKLWRKAEVRSSSASQLAGSRGASSVPAAGDREDGRGWRHRTRGGNGLIVNPLAEVPRASLGLLQASSIGVGENIVV